MGWVKKTRVKKIANCYEASRIGNRERTSEKNSRSKRGLLLGGSFGGLLQQLTTRQIKKKERGDRAQKKL